MRMKILHCTSTYNKANSRGHFKATPLRYRSVS